MTMKNDEPENRKDKIKESWGNIEFTERLYERYRAYKEFEDDIIDEDPDSMTPREAMNEIEENVIDYITKNYQDIDLIRNAVEKFDMVYKDLPDFLRANRDIALFAANLENLKHIPKSVMDDEIFATNLFWKNSILVSRENVNKYITDKDKLLEYIAEDAYFASNIPDEWALDRNFWLQAMTVNGMAIRFLPRKFWYDKEIAIAAVKQHHLVIKLLSQKFQSDPEIIKFSINKDEVRMTLEEQKYELDSWMMDKQLIDINRELPSIEKLNQPLLIKTKQEIKWEEMFYSLVKYAALNRFEPDSKIDKKLFSWYRTQKTLLKKGKLTKDREEKFQSVVFVGPSSRNKWFDSYAELSAFRSSNPQSWPIYNRDDPKSLESRLAIFCQIIRKRFRENDLEEYWIDKFLKIDFSFEAKSDYWMDYYNNVYEVIRDRQSISIKEIGENNYNWIYRNKKFYDDGVSLTQSQRLLIETLELDRYFEAWEVTFGKVKDWLNSNDKFPTRLSNKNLHSWLSSQQWRFKSGTLSKIEIEQLRNIGFDLVGLGKERDELRWKEQYKKLKIYRRLNPDRWPSFYSEGDEKQLYTWCQSQRQAQAGTQSGGRKKPLEEWKVQKLESINFLWSQDEKYQKSFEENFLKLEEFLLKNQGARISAKVNGASNPLYYWIARQRKAYKKGNYDTANFEKLLSIGIDLSK